MRNSTLQQYAKSMRQNLTKSEAIIWKYIKGCKLHGVKFRRQYIIEPYIADFAALEIKLIIEIDGATHSSDEEIIYDQKRDSYLKSLGWEILRIWNIDIYSNLSGILENLDKKIWELKQMNSSI